MSAPHSSPELRPEADGLELSPAMRAELLNPEAWREVLARYAQASKLSVGLIDSGGNLLGACHNPQPVWEFARKAKSDWSAQCPFCLAPSAPCGTTAEVMKSGLIATAHDGAGLAHVTVPLRLDDRPFGALIVGQVFDSFPDEVRLRQVARDLDIPTSEFWDLAVCQVPMTRAILQLNGELLLAFGHSFVRQLHSAAIERKLAETNRRFRLLMDSVKDYAIYTVDSSRRVTSWNRGAERMFGFMEAEMIGQESPGLFTPEEILNAVPEKELRTDAAEGPAQKEHWQIRKDGSRFLARSTLARLTSGTNLEFGQITHDITEERRREQALFEAQKMESIGVLAGGIAHDFNNMLAIVFLNAGAILEDLDPIDPKRRPLEDIVAAGHTAAGLTNQLLEYSGKRAVAPATVDLSGLVSDMLRMMEALIPKHVVLEAVLAPGLPCIEGDVSLLQQIVMNLVINASESIAIEGGFVRVSTRQADREVYLSVEDSGCGMDEATRAKIYDPFFTTKFLGRGLGLAAVSGIVRTHKGRTEIESAVGKGTTFRIYFPAIKVADSSPLVADIP